MFRFRSFANRQTALLALMIMLSAMSRMRAGSARPGETGSALSGSARELNLETAHNPVIAAVEADHSRPSWANRLWVVSMVAAAGATAADAATSWGYREANQTLRSANGTFGGRGVAIKGGMISALLVPEIILRRHESLRRMFTIGNFAEAGIFSSTAIYNVHAAATQRMGTNQQR